MCLSDRRGGGCAEGLLYFGEVNSQYVMNAAFVVSVHSDYLAMYASPLTCGAAVLSPATTFAFSKAQVGIDRYVLTTSKLFLPPP